MTSVVIHAPPYVNSYDWYAKVSGWLIENIGRPGKTTWSVEEFTGLRYTFQIVDEEKALIFKMLWSGDGWDNSQD